MSNDTALSDNQFSTALAWLMVSDPWPLTDRQRNRMVELLNTEAQRRGFDDWLDAYHEFHGRHK